ncbi:MAG: L-lactate permease [Chloroflexi bacterium]|nr:L-lactate permease [Chloroflexota bacterium]
MRPAPCHTPRQGAALTDASGPELNLANGLLASLPILVLLVTLLGLKWSAPRAGAASLLTAGLLAVVTFGADSTLLATSAAKGLSLSLFVLTIIWAAVLLYNLIDQMGGIREIGATMSRLVGGPLAQALVVGWAFSGFMQGVAGFGVPVAVVAPLLVLMGFKPVKAAAIVLVGHAWAVTFGSMGSSYYTIQLVTGIEGDVIGPHMAALFALPIVATGFAVAHIQGGLPAVRRGAAAILIIGAVIAFAVWATASLGLPQLASIVPGLVGAGAGWLLTRTPLLREPSHRTEDAALPAGATASGPAQPGEHGKRGPLGFHLAFLPYYLLILFSLLSQVPWIKDATSHLFWGLDYPAMETAKGFAVEAKTAYARIQLLRHPAPLIIFALGFSYLAYALAGRRRPGVLVGAAKQTYSQCVATSVGIATMVMMALIMTDTGMTALLGRSVAAGTGVLFPVFSPYIGVLGTFMTGSNTNSNVMFGALQLESAGALGLSAVTIASIQSIGGSLASSIAPAKVLVGTAIVGLSGRENEVMRRTIPYCLGIVLLVGIQAWLWLTVFQE